MSRVSAELAATLARKLAAKVPYLKAWKIRHDATRAWFESGTLASSALPAVTKALAAANWAPRRPAKTVDGVTTATFTRKGGHAWPLHFTQVNEVAELSIEFDSDDAKPPTLGETLATLRRSWRVSRLAADPLLNALEKNSVHFEVDSADATKPIVIRDVSLAVRAHVKCKIVDSSTYSSTLLDANGWEWSMQIDPRTNKVRVSVALSKDNARTTAALSEVSARLRESAAAPPNQNKRQ